ncbi:MAG: regulatory protein TetR [Acidimicrobiia bacterium]|nr:regulatory protein TetR [Acidimicrobiia bacterium]
MGAQAPKDRRQQTAQAMERAALELIAARGYHNVTVDEIAGAVGVHERTVLRYFRSKEEILMALPRRSGEAICDELAKRPPEESPIEAMCQAVTAAAAVVNGDDDTAAYLWGRAIATCPEAFIAVIAEQMHAMSDAMAARLQPGYSPPVARAVASAIAGALHGIWREWIDGGGTEDFTDLTCRGLRVLEAATSMAQATLADEVRELRREVEELRVDRELFRQAAVALLDQVKPGASTA